MSNFEKFMVDMHEFKGLTLEALKNIQRDIEKIDNKIIQNNGKVWEKIQEITHNMNVEKTERIQTDNELNRELNIIKAKAGIVAAIIAFFSAILANFLGWKLKQ